MGSLGLVLTTGNSHTCSKVEFERENLTLFTPDLIPLRDVAAWLGYINIVGTTGRSIGGPLGGFLADRVGWRWQVPSFHPHQPATRTNANHITGHS